MHWIQRHILNLLIHSDIKRFSELRAAGVESNLFQYHLRHIIKKGYVEKIDNGYRLAPRGLSFADRYSAILKGERRQAKIISIAIIKDAEGRILLQSKNRQPWLGQYHLPAGKIHEGETAYEAVRREVDEKTGLVIDNFTHNGSLHVRIYSDDYLVSEYYGFIFSARYDDSVSESTGMWCDDMTLIDLAPSVREILILEQGSHGVFKEIKIDVPLS